MIEFLVSAPLWLQIPLVVAVATPVAVVGAIGLLWAIDRGTWAAVGAWESVTGTDE